MDRAKPVRAVVIFRNDDPSALSDSDHEELIASIFERYRLPQVLGVIPKCCESGFRDPRGVVNVPLSQNPRMVAFLRAYAERSGSEIALHGLTHRTNAFSRPSRREFFEFRGVGLRQQIQWLQEGTRIIEDAIGVRPRSFIAPWNRLDRDTLEACADQGFVVVSAGAHTLVHERLLSLGTDCVLEEFERRLLSALSGRRSVVLRVLFHSRTVRTPEQLIQLERAVGLAAASECCEVVTLATAAIRYRELAKLANEAAATVVDQTELWGTDRARAETYKRLARHTLGLGRPEGLQQYGRCLCEDGDYEVACRLGAALNVESRRWVWGGRLSAAAGGTAVGSIAVAAGASQYGAVIIALLAALGGAVAAMEATAPDTRREIRTAGLLLSIGTMLASLIWLSLHGWRLS